MGIIRGQRDVFYVKMNELLKGGDSASLNRFVKERSFNEDSRVGNFTIEQKALLQAAEALFKMYMSTDVKKVQMTVDALNNSGCEYLQSHLSSSFLKIAKDVADDVIESQFEEKLLDIASVFDILAQDSLVECLGGEVSYEDY